MKPVELVEESESKEMPILFQEGEKKYFQKEQNWKVMRVSSCVLLGLKLMFESRYGLFQMQG